MPSTAARAIFSILKKKNLLKEGSLSNYWTFLVFLQRDQIDLFMQVTSEVWINQMLFVEIYCR